MKRKRRGSLGESKKGEVAESIRMHEASYDPVIGLSLSRTAKKVYESLPLELKTNLGTTLDHLIGARKWQKGYYSYKDMTFIIIYKVEKSPHLDIEYLLTVREIKLRWLPFLYR